jgi:hypothetical protein
MIERWQERGWYVSGADASPVALEMCPGAASVILWDFRTSFVNGARYDCVICTETAEHIEAEFADRIVDSIVTMARNIIVWSAAQPGQEWEGHVNLQPSAYWMDKFAAHGWVPIADTYKLRDLMKSTHAQHEHCAENFYVFWRKN